MIGGCKLEHDYPFGISREKLEALAGVRLAAQLDHYLRQPGAHRFSGPGEHRFVVTNANPRTKTHPSRIEVEVGVEVVYVVMFTQNKLTPNEQALIWNSVGGILRPILSPEEAVTV